MVTQTHRKILVLVSILLFFIICTGWPTVKYGERAIVLRVVLQLKFK